jgi:hypothetical protein
LLLGGRGTDPASGSAASAYVPGTGASPSTRTRTHGPTLARALPQQLLTPLFDDGDDQLLQAKWGVCDSIPAPREGRWVGGQRGRGKQRSPKQSVRAKVPPPQQLHGQQPRESPGPGNEPKTAPDAQVRGAVGQDFLDIVVSNGLDVQTLLHSTERRGELRQGKACTRAHTHTHIHTHMVRTKMKDRNPKRKGVPSATNQPAVRQRNKPGLPTDHCPQLQSRGSCADSSSAPESQTQPSGDGCMWVWVWVWMWVWVHIRAAQTSKRARHGGVGTHTSV